MARPKKKGRVAKGIQRRKGYLYIIVPFKDEDGITKERYISTHMKDTPSNVKAAIEQRSRMLNNISENIDMDISVSDYLDRYLSIKKREVSDTTYSGYFYRGNRVKKYLGDKKLKDITQMQIEKFLDDLFVQENEQPRTVKDTRTLLINVLDQAVKDALIPYNMARNVVINRKLAAQYSKIQNEDDVFFSYPEANRFLEITKNHELHDLFYVTLIFGLRREEVLGLRWSSIVYYSENGQEKAKLLINHTVTKGTGINRTNTTKTMASRREYPLNEEQRELFKGIKEKELMNRRLCGDNYYDNDYIFKHANGKPYYPDYPSKAFKTIIANSPELPQDINFHGLRKSCVSMLVHDGFDIKSIQKWVGHADVQTTLKIYAKVKGEESNEEISKNLSHHIPLLKADSE